MNPMELIQAFNSAGAIALITIGSLWLKSSLKQYAG